MIVSGRHVAALAIAPVLALVGCGDPDRDVTFDEPGMAITFRYPQGTLVHRKQIPAPAGAEAWSLASGNPDQISLTRSALPHTLSPAERRENRRATVAALKAEGPGTVRDKGVNLGGIPGYSVAIERRKPASISRVTYLFLGPAQYTINCVYASIPKLLDKACNRVLETVRRK